MRRFPFAGLRARIVLITLAAVLPVAVAGGILASAELSPLVGLAVLGAGTVWAAALGWLGTRTLILKPIDDFQRAPRRAGAGVSSARINTPPFSELEPLARRIDEMDVALRRKQEETERVVQSFRQLEESVRPLFAANPYPMLVCDQAILSILAVNESAVHFYGRPPDELIGRPFATLHPREEADALERHLTAAAPPADANGPWHHRRKDGSWREVELVYTRIAYGPRPGLLLTVRDVTGHRRAEAERDAIRRIAQRLSRPVEAREVGRILAEESRRFFRHDAFLLYRVDEGDANLAVLYAEDTPPGGAEPAELKPDPVLPRGALETEAGGLTEKPCLIRRAADPAPSTVVPVGAGNPHARALLFAPVRWADRTIGILSVQSVAPDRYGEEDLRLLEAFAVECGRALTRWQADQAMHQSERCYRSLSETAPIGIWHVDPEGRTLYVNPTMCALLEAESAGELAGAAYRSFFAPESQTLVAREAARRDEGHGALFEAELVGRRGRRCSVMASIAPLADGAGRPEGFLGTFLDITERKQVQEQSRRQLERLSALRTIDMTITASMDLRLTLHTLLDQAIHQLRADAADILRLNPQTQMLNYAAGRGFRSTAALPTPLRLGEGIAGRAALDRRIICVPDLAQNSVHPALPPCRVGENFVSYVALPLIARGLVKGILEIYHRRQFNPDREWLDFLDAVASQAAIAIDNATLFKDLQRSSAELGVAYDSTLEGWSHALDLRDRETVGHSQRVTDVTLRLARTLNLSEAELIHIRRGALLHDIGKMGVPDSILHKPGPLTEEEWEIMKRHPVYAYKMLWPIAYLRPALDIPYCHHEKWDGSGYPRGLKNEEIPLAARLFAVVDVWDALSSDRPYRKAWLPEKVREHIRTLAGTHFEAKVVDLFLDLDLSRTIREAVEANESGGII
jgi:PAS domain S-box-containing protein